MSISLLQVAFSLWQMQIQDIRLTTSPEISVKIETTFFASRFSYKQEICFLRTCFKLSSFLRSSGAYLSSFVYTSRARPMLSMLLRHQNCFLLSLSPFLFKNLKICILLILFFLVFLMGLLGTILLFFMISSLKRVLVRSNFLILSIKSSEMEIKFKKVSLYFLQKETCFLNNNRFIGT